MRAPLWGAALGLLLPACRYEVAPDIPDAGGPFAGEVSLVWAPTSWAATANFTTPQFVATPGSCPGTQMGNCCASSQPQIDIPTGGVAPITVSAGTIAIDLGGAPLGRFGFAGIGYVPLSSAESDALAWNPGDTLAVSATGGQVVAFEATIVAPPAFASVTPDLEITSQVVVRLAQDFTVSWTPPAQAMGDVTLELFDPLGFYLDCTAPDAAGSLTVPAAALGNFVAGDNGSVTLARSSTVQIQAGDSSVAVTAQATDVGLATFQ